MTVFAPPAYATIDGTIGYTTLSAAVASIGSTNCTLILPSGAHVPPATIPDNIKLEFANGAYLDFSAAPYGHPSAMANSAGLVLVTQTGHGLSTNDRIMFWNITQCGTPADGEALAEWMGLNFTPWKITKVNDNQFTLQDAPSPAAWNAYNAGVDAGKWIKLTYIQGDIIASKFQRIFNCPNGPAVSFGKVSGANVAYNRKVQTVYPEWWGAVADCIYGPTGTDNINYFNLALWSLLASYNTKQGIIELPARGGYLLSSTWCFDDINVSYNDIKVKGTPGGYIYSTAANYPAVEIIPPNQFAIEDLWIYGDATSIPTVGLLTARSLIDSNAMMLRMKNVRIMGTYQYGGYLNYNCEMNLTEDFYLKCTTTNAGFQLGLTRNMTDFGSIVPKGGSGFGSRVSDSCTYNTFQQGSFFMDYNVTDSQTIYINDAVASFNHMYLGCYGSNQDVFRIKTNCSIQLNDITTEGGAARYFYNISSATTGYFTISEHGLISRGAGTFTLNADANSRIRQSTIKDAGTIYSLGDYFYNNEIELLSGYLYLPNANSYENKIVLGSAVTGIHILNYNDNRITDWRTNYDGIMEYANKFMLGYPSGGSDSGGGYQGKLLLGGGLVTVDCGTTAPTAGSWGQGSMRLNTGVTEHGSPGWVCYQKGTFGTLSGVTANMSTGAVFCTVNSITSLHIGDFITIAGERGGNTAFRIIRIVDDGSIKKVYLDLTSDADVTGAAVAYSGPPLFHTMAPNLPI